MLIPCIYFDKDIIFCKKMQPRRLKMEAPALTTQKIGSVTCSGAALKLAVLTFLALFENCWLFSRGSMDNPEEDYGEEELDVVYFLSAPSPSGPGGSSKDSSRARYGHWQLLCVDSLR